MGSAKDWHGYRTLIYLYGQRWLAPDNLMERNLPAKGAEPITRMKEQNVGLIAVCLISVAFWAAYEQQGNTLALWADTHRPPCLRVGVPASWYQSATQRLCSS
jgi:POT family proton-dependent oligopeptide transporter